MKIDRKSESGSVIIWIFIAVILFAALSFTVSNISRTGNPAEMGELASMRATDIMQYAGAIQRGIRFMRIGGVDESELCFHASQWGHADYEFNPQCTDNGNRIFHADGGAIGFQDGPDNWYSDSATAPPNDSRAWVFSSRYEVTDVGTDSGGATTVAANADLIIATAPVRDDACEAINRMLDYTPVTPPAVAASTYDNMATTAFVGTFASLAGRIGALGRERCVADPGGFNVYYKVILAR